MKNRDSLHRLFDSWQYVMLAVAIFIAIIFCCYYIVSQSRWGFYTSGGIHDVENPVFSPLKEVATDGDKEAETKRALHLTMAHPEIPERYWTFLMQMT